MDTYNFYTGAEMSSNMPTLYDRYLTEPASTYYFNTDYQNNQYIIIPLFVKTALQDVTSIVIQSFQILLLVLTRLYSLLIFAGTNVFEKTVDITVYAVAYVVKSALMPLYNYLKTTFLFRLTSIDKIVIALVGVYFLFTAAKSFLKRNNKHMDDLLEQIDKFEKHLLVLKTRDRQHEMDMEYLIQREPAHNNNNNTSYQELLRKHLILENKMKQIVKQLNQLKKISD